MERVEFFFLNTHDYTPINIGSYIPTPKAIATKKAVINIQNKNDNKCFEYSVLAALLHKEIKHHAERRYQYKKYLGKRLKGCKELMRIEDIPNLNLRMMFQLLYIE